MAKRRHRCKDCGITDEEGARISYNGLCEQCGQRRQAENAAGMRRNGVTTVDGERIVIVPPRVPIGRPITPYPPGA